MWSLTSHLCEGFLAHLRQAYQDLYGDHNPDYLTLILQAGRQAVETIATSTALYHNVEHTVLVTLVGQDILRGKQRCDGTVTARDWAHVVIALCYHDIGYVRGACRQDRQGTYTTGVGDALVTVPRGATDAALTPYHVDRGQQYVRERYAHEPRLDVEVLTAAIERTRFPVPAGATHSGTADYPGLVRAADLIGQMADPHYLRKLPALFYEFTETGAHKRLGYTSPADLLEGLPAFFWQGVAPYIQDGLRYLQGTAAGRQWLAQLAAHVGATAPPPGVSHPLRAA